MEEISSREIASSALERLANGAFLNVKQCDEMNVMTISWGMVGIVWRKDVFQVLVRKSRHSYNMLEESKCFTVSLPKADELKEAIAYCGKHSGRDGNKFEGCNITPIMGQSIDCHIIKECDLHFECKVMAKQDLKEEHLFHDLDHTFYSNDDYHTMFYGEIVDCYRTE